MKKLYLVDVSSMFFRAFYAIRPLSTPAGVPVNAVYGFLSMTVKLLREAKPDYMVYCFDRPEPSFRKALDERYKANRSEMPPDLIPQVPYIRKLSEALGIPCVDRLGFEADDIIGTLTDFGRSHDLEVVIVSGDKDFGQLIRPHVTMYDTMKDIRYDSAGVLEKWGVRPDQIRDYLAIIGDSSDNVPGVKGIGPKGAEKLFAQFQTLDEIYQNLDKIDSKSIVKKLEEGKSEAFLSRKLIEIVCDVPLEMQEDDLKLKPIHRSELQAILLELDFKNFAKTLLGDPSVSDDRSSSATATSLLGGASSLVKKVNSTNGSAKNTDAVKTVAANSGESATPGGQSQKEISLEGHHVETSSSLGMNDAELVSFAENLTEVEYDVAQLQNWLKENGVAWAFLTEGGLYLAQDAVVARVSGSYDELAYLLKKKNLEWKGYDLKSFFKTVQLKQGRVIWDHMLAAYVVKMKEIEGLDSLLSEYNGQSMPDLATGKQIYLAHVTLEKNIRKKLAELGLEKVLYDLELPLVPILAAMESAGILLDSEVLREQSIGLQKDIQNLEKQIHVEAGEVFNIASPKQIAQVLFEKLKMPVGKKMKTGYSTDNDVLEKLAEEFPICRKILDYRELAKLKSTYVDSLPSLVNRETGRIHTTFNQALTSTGRLSSTHPNLQNIPIRTERGNLIRKAFVAADGHKLISADYSQIELRILAHITQDQGLMRAFFENVDVHAVTASEVFEVKLEEVTSDMRRKAKAVNFGLAYGQGAYGLAENLRISRGEASDIINRYFARFPGVKNFMTETIELAKQKGYVETIFGRRRYLDELQSPNQAVRKFGERAAINAPIQGTASDLVKIAMIHLYKGDESGHAGSVLSKHHAKMLLQVHDELIFEVPDRSVESAEREIKAVMESVVKLSVPLSVNTSHGRSWYDT